MAGLLDFLNTDEGRLGLGLLAAAGPRSDGMGFGGRVQEAFAGQDARKKQQAEAEWRTMQMEEARAQMAQRQQAMQREQQMQAAYMRAQTPGAPGLSPLLGDPAAGILPSQGRAAVPAGFNAQQFANEAGEIDWKQGIALQQALQKENTINKLDVKDFTPQSVAKYAQTRNYGDLVRLDKAHFANTGGQTMAMDPFTGKPLNAVANTQSPDSLASNAITMRGQNLSNSLGWANHNLSGQRLAFDQGGGDGGATQAGLNKQFGKAQAGYRWKSDGSLEFIPGGPADQKAQAQKGGEGTVGGVVADLRDKYTQLDSENGIVSTRNRFGTNMGAWAGATGLGQTFNGMVGTKTQSSRDSIAMTRPLLLQAIMKATGMSAKQMDSNAELKLYLATATDPQKGLEANMAALDRIETLYGGGRTEKPPAPKPLKPSSTPGAWSIQRAD